MDSELDLEDLDLKEEQAEETATVETEEVVEKPDIIDSAEDMVIQVIGQNVFDVDLEQSLRGVVDTHFKAIKERPAYEDGTLRIPDLNADIFRIPDLNQEIWKAFHDYEDFIHQNKFENIDLNEIAAILREKVVPKITRYLWDLTTQQSQ